MEEESLDVVHPGPGQDQEPDPEGTERGEKFEVKSPPKNAADPVGQQLPEWKRTHPKVQNITARNMEGIPAQNLTSSLTVGQYGPMVLLDSNYTKQMSNFARRLTPNRPMAGKGQGAFGYFQVTQDISDICCARVFSEVGKKTDLFGRFSSNYAVGQFDTSNTLHTMSIKMYTEEGNFDILGGHLPIFDARDPFTFVFGTGRAEQVNPQTGIQDDNNAIWDFITLRPERLFVTLLRNCVTCAYPYTFRSADYYAINVFKMINSKGVVSYVRYTFKTMQETKFITRTQALDQGDADPFFQFRDLYNAIARGESCKWKLCIQVLPSRELGQYAKTVGYDWDPFDPTKEWPLDKYPLREVGIVCFTHNQNNHHNEAELSCFSPGNVPPGIKIAPQDRILSARVLCYHDSHLYRCGTNFAYLPVNRARGVKNYKTYARDGFMDYDFGKQGAAPNYFPNTYGGPREMEREGRGGGPVIGGEVGRYDLRDEDNYTQPRQWYQKITNSEKEDLASNLAFSMRKTARFIQNRAFNELSKIDPRLAQNVRSKIRSYNNSNNNNDNNSNAVANTVRDSEGQGQGQGQSQGQGQDDQNDEKDQGYQGEDSAEEDNAVGQYENYESVGEYNYEA